ncbi:hypothetical protein KIW84_045137 [Lathyrus oleraceus]|uniref:U-box domain-containing protein n=1 Tax=Pisum sativum TaxID=3888 RepID=A0A9D5AWV7_PEA|nr:hypothetical protein KIW84_045137 [Pisum sativum]
MVGLELIPIGTILAVLTSQVVRTANAAKDVLIDKKSFNILFETPVLKELRLQDLNEAEFEASQSQLDIVDKLNHGIKEQKLDQAFANNMLEEIAGAVGVPVEPSEIIKEIANIRWEKEEAANSKERAEVIFLEQIISLLSQADTASDFEEVKKQYFQRVQVIERYGSREKYIPPLNSFYCSITEVVMVDPISLCTGTTCERSTIEVWFHDGNMTDPKMKEVLEDTTLRSNIRLRESIV